MKWKAWGFSMAAAFCGAASAVALPGDPSGTPTELAMVDGKAGFAVSKLTYALAAGEAQPDACPAGLSAGYRNVGDVFRGGDFKRGETETDDAYFKRVFVPAVSNPETKDLCTNPELGGDDPGFRTVSAPDIVADGMDLDAPRARKGSMSRPGFRGANGEVGIDNQFYRVVGCTRPFRPNGQHTDLTSDLLSGQWGLLISLEGVDDLVNDPEVRITIAASRDPLKLSSDRHPLRYASYTADADRQYQATVRGRIVDHRLISDPVDLNFYTSYENLWVERPMHAARLNLAFTDDGKLEGLLAGFMPVDAIYDAQFGFRRASDRSGKVTLSRNRVVGVGSAITQGYTCEGVYRALQRNADGDCDPQTGRCSAISVQYRLQAVPAFVFTGGQGRQAERAK